MSDIFDMLKDSFEPKTERRIGVSNEIEIMDAEIVELEKSIQKYLDDVHASGGDAWKAYNECEPGSDFAKLKSHWETLKKYSNFKKQSLRSAQALMNFIDTPKEEAQ